MNLVSKKKNRKARKGFSLVELVVVILIIAILAVAVFAGGSAVIKKSQVSRTTSDLHNFSIAVESFLNSTPKVANATNEDSTGAPFSEFIDILNSYLPQDYQLSTTPIDATAASALQTATGGNITVNTLATTASNTVAVYESVKTDAWDNHYYVILDSGERHGDSNSDFYVTIVSAGSDAKTDLAGTIGGAVDADKIDDVFLLVQYMNGDVAAVTYAMPTTLSQCSDMTTMALTEITISETNRPTYNAADSNAAVLCPVNF